MFAGKTFPDNIYYAQFLPIMLLNSAKKVIYYVQYGVHNYCNYATIYIKIIVPGCYWYALYFALHCSYLTCCTKYYPHEKTCLIFHHVSIIAISQK